MCLCQAAYTGVHLRSVSANGCGSAPLPATSADMVYTMSLGEAATLGFPPSCRVATGSASADAYDTLAQCTTSLQKHDLPLDSPHC